MSITINEVDNSSPTAVETFAGIPAAVIGTAKTGPAFVPQLVNSEGSFNETFGDVDSAHWGSVAVRAWYNEAQANAGLVYLRVLGAGDGKKRTTNNRVNRAGFVVGSKNVRNENEKDLYSSVTVGALAANPYANETFATRGTGAAGRTYFLSTIMSQSEGSTYLSDAGLSGTRDPILRAVILVASGVQLQLSGWRPGDSGENPLSGSAHAMGGISGSAGNEDAGNWIGAYSESDQSVKLILNGLKDSTSRVINFGLNPDNGGYLGSVNMDPEKFDEAGHYLYAHYPVPSALAVPSELSEIHTFTQKDLDQSNQPIGLAKRYFHNVLLTTGSASRNEYGASGYVPNYEGWEDRFSTPFTPWVISQPVGGTEVKLFRFHALDDGQGTEDQYFAQISNIIYPTNSDEYAKFKLTVRRYGVQNSTTATQPIPGDNSILFEKDNLTLDPNDTNYIARVIGDYHRYYNFDVNTDEQKLVLAGMYENTNKYFRVEVAADVANGKTAKDLVPFGYQGMHHLVTSGSSEMLSDIQAGEKWYEPNLYGEADHTDGYPILSGGFAGIGQGMIVPPVPMRTKTKNQKNSETLFPWGVRFDRPGTGFLYTDEGDSTAKSLTGNNQGSAADQKVNNSSNLWAAGKEMDLIRQLNKFYPSYSVSPMWVGDNAGVANTANGAVLDSDAFNNNKFSLSKVLVATKTVNSVAVPDDTRWHQAYYVRDGVDPVTSGFRFLQASDLKSANDTQRFTEFILPFQGGFDGLNIFDKNKSEMNHWAAHFEQENSSTQGGLLGPTVASYRKAIDIIAEKTDVDINALAIPGQRSSFITEYASNKMEERFDAIYLMDIELCDSFGSGAGNILFDGNDASVLDPEGTRFVDTAKTIERFAARGLNSSFSAAYFPNVSFNFNIGTSIASYDDAPASIAALAAFARTDRREGAWGTPAGYDNGKPDALINAALRLNAKDAKDLAVNAINPIVIFNDNVNPQQLTQTDLGTAGTGIINGQRTLLNKDSALSRLDVRKLMVYIRRQTRNIAYSYIFEPNQSSVLSRFSQEVEVLLESLVTAGAVAQYRVVIDETTTSQADIENNTVRGKVFVQPYRSVEIIAIDININNSDQA